MKKKRQDELQQLKEQREKVRKEREAARKKKMEEKRLAKEEKNKLKEQEKREKEERKRQQQELLRQEKEEKELAQEQEEARKRQEEARNIREEQVRLEAVEKERILKKEESLKKREMLRKKVEEQRLLREQQQKQERARVLENQKELKQESYLRKLKEAEVRIQKLQESKLTAVPKTPGTSGYLNTTYTASGDTTLESNYNMTPRGPDRPLLPSTEENYNIDDFQSDDSTDEEDKPKKVVPRWAKGLPLQAACVKQYNTPPDIDRIFLGLLKPVELNKLFKNCNKPRYFKRTSSAHWSSPIMPHAHTSFTQQCKGFN
uniref:Inner centromere protein ARK-binding domain-containing protein n=1 Tax=Ciona savignyi TaxID=51511 RepID=H2YXD2_CIOSA